MRCRTVLGWFAAVGLLGAIPGALAAEGEGGRTDVAARVTMDPEAFRPHLQRLTDNEVVARVEERRFVLTVKAPAIIRRGDRVLITAELRNEDEVVHSPAFHRGVRTAEGDFAPEGAFQIAVSRDGRFVQRSDMRAVPDGPYWGSIRPGQTITSEIDITPTVKQIGGDAFLLHVGVGLNGQVQLPWPNRYGFGISVAVSLEVMDPEAYDAIVQTEKEQRERAATQPAGEVR